MRKRKEKYLSRHHEEFKHLSGYKSNFALTVTHAFW